MRFIPFLLLLCLLSQVSLNQAQGDLYTWDEVFIYRSPEELLARRQPGDIILMATGDVMLARTINRRMVASGDFLFPFANMRDLLSQADITWVNLETPLMANCPLKDGGLIFCADGRAVSGLVSAGVDVANLANNHTENYGEPGLRETQQILSDAGIQSSGVRQPVIIELHGKKIGLLGFNTTTFSHWISSGVRENVLYEIQQARPLVDYLIIALHHGQEYSLQPNVRQRTLIKPAIDAGADLVIGHHPHWLQGVEFYHGKRIIYSLGNFIFDQEHDEWVQYGAVAYINIRASGGMQINLLPVVIEDTSTPRLATEAEAAMILARIASVSQSVPDD